MISVKALTETGSRKVNEDSIGQYMDDSKALFVVADGLGGHGAGDVASQYVVEQFLTSCGQLSASSDERYMSMVFSNIQSGLLTLQKKRHKDMKSTAAAVLLRDRQLTICHVGDSRVYLFGKRKLLYRTLDHSVPQMLVSADELKERDIRGHPDRNRLTRALGEEAEFIDYDLHHVPLTDDARAMLICSDGFWEHITERRMLQLLRRAKRVEDWLEDMEKVVLKNGKDRSMDNYSAIAVFFDKCNF